MRAVFAHDHIFYRYNDNMYSTGGLSKEMLERYTSIFEEVVVLSRQKNIRELNTNLTLATTERVTFVEVPNYMSFRSYALKHKAVKIINEQVVRADYVIARNSSIASIAIKCAKKNKKPYLVEMVSCAWDALWNHSFKGKLIAPFRYIQLKKEVRESPYVVYVTNKFLQRRYPTKGNQTSCSNVALTEFDSEVLKRRIDKINQMSRDTKIIIGTTAAVNVKYKGQEYVIRALAELKNQGLSNFEYQLVGSGSPVYLKSIADKYDVSDQVKFLGAMPHYKVFDWLETIDIYAQPSKQEGLPRALIEAMSRAVPSIGAKTAGIPELLDDKFIFSNSKKNIIEISKILKNYNKEYMLLEATRNFEESKKYDKKIIEKRRNQFFREFKNSNVR